MLNIRVSVADLLLHRNSKHHLLDHVVFAEIFSVLYSFHLRWTLVDDSFTFVSCWTFGSCRCGNMQCDCYDCVIPNMMETLILCWIFRFMLQISLYAEILMINCLIM